MIPPLIFWFYIYFYYLVFQITLNLWNEKINEFKGKKEDIIAIKNAKIREYNYIKNLPLINSSRISINLGVPEAIKIREECQEQNQDTELDETMYTKIEKILNLVNQTIINVLQLSKISETLIQYLQKMEGN